MQPKLILLFLLNVYIVQSYGQDPVLPAANLGMAVMEDGNSPGPGLYYQSYIQVYSARNAKGPDGATLSPGVKVNSLLSMHQFIYESKLNVAGGHLAFTALLPLVKLSVNKKSKLSVNPGVLGGLILGTALQWSGKRLFHLPYSHRVEAGVSLPVGSHSQDYDINPAARFYTGYAYYAFTLYMTKQLSFSNRHYVNYNSREKNGRQAGMFYNTNFSLEHTIYKTLRAAVTGYYLGQIAEDAYYGDRSYYQDTYGLTSTRERVLGIGPGISYLTKTGLFAELKVFFETAGQNRTEGIRCSLRLAYKLN